MEVARADYDLRPPLHCDAPGHSPGITCLAEAPGHPTAEGEAAVVTSAPKAATVDQEAGRSLTGGTMVRRVFWQRVALRSNKAGHRKLLWATVPLWVWGKGMRTKTT